MTYTCVKGRTLDNTLLARLDTHSHSYTLPAGTENGQPLWKGFWQNLPELHMHLPFDSTITLLGTWRGYTPPTRRNYICTGLFVSERYWKLPECTIIGDGEWPTVHSQPMQSYIALKKSEQDLHELIQSDFQYPLRTEKAKCKRANAVCDLLYKKEGEIRKHILFTETSKERLSQVIMKLVTHE